MKLNFQHLVDGDFSKMGNIFLKNNVNINLLAGTIKSENKIYQFNMEYDKNKMTVEKFDSIYKMLQSLKRG